jgi:hypothetical protein
MRGERVGGHIKSLSANDERVFKMFTLGTYKTIVKLIFNHSGTLRKFRQWGEFLPGYQLPQKDAKGKIWVTSIWAVTVKIL